MCGGDDRGPSPSRVGRVERLRVVGGTVPRLVRLHVYGALHLVMKLMQPAEDAQAELCRANVSTREVTNPQKG